MKKFALGTQGLMLAGVVALWSGVLVAQVLPERSLGGRQTADSNAAKASRVPWLDATQGGPLNRTVDAGPLQSARPVQAGGPLVVASSVRGAGPLLGSDPLFGAGPLLGATPLFGEGLQFGVGQLLDRGGPLAGIGPLQGAAPLLAGGPTGIAGPINTDGPPPALPGLPQIVLVSLSPQDLQPLIPVGLGLPLPSSPTPSTPANLPQVSKQPDASPTLINSAEPPPLIPSGSPIPGPCLTCQSIPPPNNPPVPISPS
jgi:hypothetical protein